VLHVDTNKQPKDRDDKAAGCNDPQPAGTISEQQFVASPSPTGVMISHVRKRPGAIQWLTDRVRLWDSDRVFWNVAYRHGNPLAGK
jgi:hypothetical protein